MKPERKLISVAEFATITGVSRCYVYQLIKERKIPHVKIGGRKLAIPKSYIDNLLSSAK